MLFVFDELIKIEKRKINKPKCKIMTKKRESSLLSLKLRMEKLF